MLLCCRAAPGQQRAVKHQLQVQRLLGQRGGMQMLHI
jgi:hypothetical protein